MGGVYLGFVNYAVSLWIVSGLLMLQLDVIGYELASMSKEKRVTRFLGWLNITLGILLFIGNWAFQKWFW